MFCVLGLPPNLSVYQLLWISSSSVRHILPYPFDVHPTDGNS